MAMKNVNLLTIVFASLFSFMSGDRVEPSKHCAPGMYKELDASKRNPNIMTPGHTTVICDTYPTMLGGWFRLTGVADDRLTTQCVPEYRCGTVSPIWVNDTLPHMRGTGKPVTVCTADYGNCCSLKGQAYAQNCGSYFVYYLQAVTFCPQAYCVGQLNPSSTIASSTNPPSTTVVSTVSPSSTQMLQSGPPVG